MLPLEQPRGATLKLTLMSVNGMHRLEETSAAAEAQQKNLETKVAKRRGRNQQKA